MYTLLMFLIIAAVCGSLWSLSCLSLFFFSLFLSAFWLHFRGKKCTVKWLAVAKQLPECGSYSCVFTWARSFTLSISDESVRKFKPFHMHLENLFLNAYENVPWNPALKGVRTLWMSLMLTCFEKLNGTRQWNFTNRLCFHFIHLMENQVELSSAKQCHVRSMTVKSLSAYLRDLNCLYFRLIKLRHNA